MKKNLLVSLLVLGTSASSAFAADRVLQAGESTIASICSDDDSNPAMAQMNKLLVSKSIIAAGGVKVTAPFSVSAPSIVAIRSGEVCVAVTVTKSH